MNFWKPVLFVSLFFAVLIQAEEIHLKDGTVLQGTRVGQKDSIVEFHTSLGDVGVRESQIEWEQATPSPAPISPEKEGIDPSGQTLVLMPTAFTPPQGSWNFKDFELLFLTLGYSPTPTTSISVGTLFPLDPTLIDVFTLGIKQQLYMTPDGEGAIAVDADVLKFFLQDVSNNIGIWTISLIGSWEFEQGIGLHGEVGLLGPLSESGTAVSTAVGTDVRLTPHVKFIAEYLRGEVTSDDIGSASVINVGFRLHGEKLSADICGFRPLEETDGLFFWPMINIGYRF